jgi:hypothetical protein
VSLHEAGDIPVLVVDVAVLAVVTLSGVASANADLEVAEGTVEDHVAEFSGKAEEWGLELVSHWYCFAEM